jgi:hypothetical protein
MPRGAALTNEVTMALALTAERSLLIDLERTYSEATRRAYLE